MYANAVDIHFTRNKKMETLCKGCNKWTDCVRINDWYCHKCVQKWYEDRE